MKQVLTPLTAPDRFGRACIVTFPVPSAGEDYVLIAVQKETCLVPVEICLLHQLYQDKIETIAMKHDNADVFVFPLRSGAKVQVYGEVKS